MDFIKVAYDQNSIRSVTRRWLAFMVVGPTMLFFILAAVFHGIGVFMTAPVEVEDWINPAILYSKFLFKMPQTLVPWAGGVLVFYFGPHLLGAMSKKS